MKCLENVKLGLLAMVVALGVAVKSEAQGQPPKLRNHTVTEAQELLLVPANKQLGRSKVEIEVRGAKRLISANGMPNHSVGRFPNRGNPHQIKPQRYNFSMPVTPKRRKTQAQSLGQLFGVAVNGVPFDPGAAEFWRGDRRSGWQYDALGGAVPLGLDSNYAHVQPTGAYHYHGLPVGLMRALGWTRGAASPLIGYAADGFPIYALRADVGGRVQDMKSSYRLRSGNRDGANGPNGRYDGTFVQDYRFVKGAGDLDECNGAFVTSSDYPNGTYAYFLTDSFPVIPRCLRGKADKSFSKRR